MAIIDLDTIKMLIRPEFWRMTYLWTGSLLYSYILVFAGDVLTYIRPPPVSPRQNQLGGRKPHEQQMPPVCVITGASSGLGAAAAKELAEKGYCVVLVGRSLQLLSETMQGIMQQNNSAKLKAFDVDMSSIQSLLQFKCSLEDWLSKSGMHPSIQLLINNAGILAVTPRTTSDGYDEMMETNYISAFLLTNLLWPLLRKSEVPSRIVNVTSLTHRCVSNPPLMAKQNLECYMSQSRDYPLANTYEYTKFWLLLFTYELHRKCCQIDPTPKVSVVAADPGLVKTNIARELPKPISKWAIRLLSLVNLMQPSEVGVASIVDAAMAPPEVSGQYFFGGNGRTIRSSRLSYNTKLAKDLWETSMAVFREVTSKGKHSSHTGEGILV